MDMETEVTDTPKLPSVSPTMQSDLSMDGDLSINQNASNSDDKLSPALGDAISSEPKAKKRRKQSNPLKIQNPESPKFDLPLYELSEQGAVDENEVLPLATDNGLQNQNNNVIEKSKTPDYASSKGSLSRVTNALFNKAAKASTNSSKSKDSSLQSLTDISSPESSEEIMPIEFKTAMQNAYSQMPPLLPMNPLDMARDVVKFNENIYNFSDFSSPVQQGNMNLSISQRSFVTSNGVRVFNPEAYCELCEKEFCNKYFLKTHKANKHGISSHDNSSGGYTYKVSYKNMQTVSSPSAQQMISQMCENGATFGSADSYCNICQKYFCNKYFLKKHRQNIHGIHEESALIPSSIHVPVISSPLPLVRQMSLDSKSLDVSGTKDEDSKINVSMENIKNTLNCNVPLLNGSSPQNKTQKDKKGEKFLCELCNIEFCDKCYLDAHKLNKHGLMKKNDGSFPDFMEVGKVENSEKPPSPSVDNNEGKESFKEQMCTPCMKNFTSAESFQYHMLEVHGASLKQEEIDIEPTTKKNGPNSMENENEMDIDGKSPSSHELESSNSSTDSASLSCNFCLMKCKDKKAYVSHLESEHNILGSTALDMCLLQESTSCDICEEQFLDRLAVMSHKYKVHGIVPAGLEAFSDGRLENGEYSSLSSGRQKSGGSSFCTFCNKELCNKYFMKTHMLKMHGIDVDKTQQEQSPSTTSGGVLCDICQKFLCSKYFLKIHKQNVHGIIDDGAKLGSPLYNNNLALNDKKVEWPSIASLQSAKLHNKDLGSSNSEPGKVNNGNVFLCEICGQEFADKVMLQFHLVNKHVKSSEGKVYPHGVISQILSGDSKEIMKGGLLPCSCCSFMNLDDNSKLPQLGSSELKMISCTMCNVTYHENDYHTHHLSHGISLPTGKNFENGIHEFGIGYNDDIFDPSKRNGLEPRKLKRFRCSKCDKTFRTKLRCLTHIQVMHKSKKAVPSDSPKKSSHMNNGYKKGPEQKNITENGLDLARGDKLSLPSSGFPNSGHLPAPYKLPKNSDVIMQPFHLTEPKPDGVSKQNIFVPSLVYLPVSQKVSESITVAFTLTPA